MSIEATRALSVQPWRVVVYLSGWDLLLLTASTWRVTRAGGAPVPVAQAWAPQPGAYVAELSLTEPLAPGVLYTVEAPAVGVLPVEVAYHDPTAATELGDDLFAADDPEGEAYGEDWDWTAEAPDVTGDLPRVRGITCLRHDLAAVAQTSRGELPHRPTTGLGLRERVNGASTPARLLELQGEVRSAYLEDDRVEGAQVSVSSAGDGSGVTVIRANVSPRPVGGEPVSVTVRL